MTIGAVVFMGLTWAGVLGLTVFCFWKVLVPGGRRGGSRRGRKG